MINNVPPYVRGVDKGIIVTNNDYGRGDQAIFFQRINCLVHSAGRVMGVTGKES